MLQNLQNFAEFQKCQLDNLVDFEKCCQTHIYLQNFVLIQPKTSENLPKFCQKLATTDPPGVRPAGAAAGAPTAVVLLGRGRTSAAEPGLLSGKESKLCVHFVREFS